MYKLKFTATIAKTVLSYIYKNKLNSKQVKIKYYLSDL
mgnify:CR=1 FL=1